VFEKVRDESAGRAGAGDCAEIKLRTLLSVPRGVAGRIIGRQGRNVREIQRMTGAAVKLTDDDTATDETTAEVYGNFMATQVHSLSLLHTRTSILKIVRSRLLYTGCVLTGLAELLES